MGFLLDTETYLAVIKSSDNSEVVDIGIGDGSHLGFLDGRDTPFWMENKNGDVFFVTESIDGGTMRESVEILSERNGDVPACISAGSSHHSQPLLLFTCSFTSVPSRKEELE